MLTRTAISCDCDVHILVVLVAACAWTHIVDVRAGAEYQCIQRLSLACYSGCQRSCAACFASVIILQVPQLARCG